MAFFESIIGAGAILSGFCGTFLAFRIQRESNYYRQPMVSFELEKGKDVFIGLTRFSPAFKLLVLGTCSAAVFGFLLPLLALAGCTWIATKQRLVVAGLVGTVFLIGSYFLAELVHYQILNAKFLRGKREEGDESSVVYAGISVASLLGLLTYCALHS
jgi:hypothetical protein